MHGPGAAAAAALHRPRPCAQARAHKGSTAAVALPQQGKRDIARRVAPGPTWREAAVWHLLFTGSADIAAWAMQGHAQAPTTLSLSGACRLGPGLACALARALACMPSARLRSSAPTQTRSTWEAHGGLGAPRPSAFVPTPNPAPRLQSPHAPGPRSAPQSKSAGCPAGMPTGGCTLQAGGPR